MEKEKKFSTLPVAEKVAEIHTWLEDHKGQNINALEINTALTDAVVIVTASSVRHAKSLADGLMELCKEKNFEFFRMEGYDAGQWILADLNDVIVHIFQENIRDEYRLESLWREAEPLILKGRSEAQN